MGWRAFFRDGTEKSEGTDGRPVQDGDEGLLAAIAQEDYGHNVAVDLNRGIIAIDYESISMNNGTVELVNPKTFLWVCDETNVVGDMFHLRQEFVDFRDEDGKRVLVDGRYPKVRNDILTPLTWRPIWFTRVTMGIPTKVIGAQTTLPDMM